jgi:hypothetical protein
LQIDYLVLRINQETCEWSITAVETQDTKKENNNNLVFEFKRGNVSEATEKVTLLQISNSLLASE